jgi:hypothetical protein
MSDDQSLPTLPADIQMSWLARNRKLVILGGITLVLVVGAAVTVLWKSPKKTASVINTVTTNTVTTVGTTTTNRPTFQRSTVTNTPTTLPQTYRPPTTDDLRKAITNLNPSTNPKP